MGFEFMTQDQWFTILASSLVTISILPYSWTINAAKYSKDNKCLPLKCNMSNSKTYLEKYFIMQTMIHV